MYVIERWTGKAWASSMCSPYKTYTEVNNHLKQYWWHYTEEFPYRIKDFKPKKKAQYNTPKFNPYNDWNSDRGMIVKI